MTHNSLAARAQLKVGEVWDVYGSLRSPNGRFTLDFIDGGLFLYDDRKRELWTAAKESDAEKAKLGDDGNFVLYDWEDVPLWSTQTAGQGDRTSTLLVQDNGNVEIVSSGKTIWSTNTGPAELPPTPPAPPAPPKTPRTKADRLELTQELLPNEALVSPNGLYCLRFQDDGNFVLYQGTDVRWKTDTITRYGRPARIVITADGNLQLFNSDERGEAIDWESRSATANITDPVLILQDSGNVVITSADNKIIWSTKTGTTPRKPRTKPNQLQIGDMLKKGEYLVSPNGKYKMFMQDDGNVVLYAGSSVLWKTDTGSFRNVWLQLQDDSNLVLVEEPKRTIWTTWTHGRGDESTVLTLEDDANLALCVGTKEIWSANTRQKIVAKPDRLEANQTLIKGDFRISPNETTKLIMQDDGNLVLYVDAKPVWNSRTTTNVARLVLENDGNLVIYRYDNKIEWLAGSHAGNGVPTLVVQDDGNAVIYKNGIETWSTGTKRK